MNIEQQKELDKYVMEQAKNNLENLVQYIVDARIGYIIEEKKKLEGLVLMFRQNYLVPRTEDDALRVLLLKEFDNHFGIITTRTGHVQSS